MALPALSQMTAVRVLENMLQEYERGIKNIDDYTVVTNLYTAQYKKTYVNGRPVFKSRMQLRGMEPFGGEAATSTSMGHTELFDAELFEFLKQNARYEGTRTINGFRTHVLFVKDLEPLADEQDPDHPKNVYIYVDAEKWVTRKMEFEVESQYEDEEFRTIKPVIQFLDYRNVHGMQVPYRTVIDLGDVGGTISPEEKEEARHAMAQLQQELERMPEQQRRMMENMLRPQIEQLQKVLEGDSFVIEVTVDEIRVNTGLTDELFD